MVTISANDIWIVYIILCVLYVRLFAIWYTNAFSQMHYNNIMYDNIILYRKRKKSRARAYL